MNEILINCDQAIFTSLRGTMGEGYRIVACSKGLKPEEKQAITRLSPSQDALCLSPSDEKTFDPSKVCAAYYPLPGGRLCVALSCYAGAEHTGRGGHRAYTHNLILTEEQFASCAYNPFHVIRAMISAGMNTPQLSPPQNLSVVDLRVKLATSGNLGKRDPGMCSIPVLRFLLNAMLASRHVVGNVAARWLETAEMVLLGVPGPMRAQLSMGAGLKFSVGRSHHLQLLQDATTGTKTRATGQHSDYIDGCGAAAPATPASAWLTLVERMWNQGDWAYLSHRTSKPFQDAGPESRERLARWYQCIDDAANMELTKLLAVAAEHFAPRKDPIEGEIVGELLAGIQRELLRRLNVETWPNVFKTWSPLLAQWRRSDVGFTWSTPLVEAVFRSALRNDPAAAGALVMDMTRHSTGESHEQDRREMVEGALMQLVKWAEGASDEQITPMRRVVDSLRTHRPACPLSKRLLERCAPKTPVMARR
ncbi:MAG: hypothetical protein AABZ47_09585 [Planctomycetota bacterium]